MTTHPMPQTSVAPMPPPTVSPVDTPAAYGLQARRSPWWKGVLSIVAIAVAYVVASIAFMIPAGIVGNLLGLQGTVNAATLAGLNLAWGAMIVLAPLIMRLVHGVPRGAIGSIRGGFRWGRMAKALIWVVPLYLASTVVLALVGPSMGNGVITPALLAIFGVVLLTTPLQAAGEEFAFRGAVNVSAASWGRTQRSAMIIGAVVSSLVFGAAHGATDPWLAVYYTAFGFGCWIITRLTDGLEVSTAIHVFNNVISFASSVVMGVDPNTMFDRSAGKGGPFVLLPIAAMAIACLITWLLTRRERATR
ncbi:lysostaphin resistance A-like protein [Mariniluteicoccus flavus]